MEQPIIGRRRLSEQHQNLDRLSKLPDSLIIEILSMLEMKDAVKTGMLSKRWTNLWTQVYNFVFEFRDVERDEENMSHDQILELKEVQKYRWISFVDHALMRCTANINRFCLCSSWDFSAAIGKWIAYVLEKNVKILELRLPPCRVPDCLYQSSSITKLKLHKVKVRVSFPVNWISLKSLSLVQIWVDDVSIDKILMGSPLLETFVLRNVRGINHLNIMSPAVKKLELYDIQYDGGNGIHILEIRAPWLQELVISKRFLVRQCQLVDVSSLVKATVTFTTRLSTLGDIENNLELKCYNYGWIRMVNKLLTSLYHVGELIIGSELIQVLTTLKFMHKPTPIFKCKQLSVETRFWKYDLLGIACLLENSPDLETLSIKVLGDWEDSCPLYQAIHFFTKYGGPQLSMPPNRNLVHLKNVKIDYWRHPCRDTSEHRFGQFFDFELVEFILKGAVVLEKLVLCSSNSSWHCCGLGLTLNCRSFQYVPRLSSKLLTTILVGNEASAEWGELRKSKNKFEFSFSNYKSLFPEKD